MLCTVLEPHKSLKFCILFFLISSKQIRNVGITSNYLIPYKNFVTLHTPENRMKSKNVSLWNYSMYHGPFNKKEILKTVFKKRPKTACRVPGHRSTCNPLQILDWTRGHRLNQIFHWFTLSFIISMMPSGQRLQQIYFKGQAMFMMFYQHPNVASGSTHGTEKESRHFV